MEGLIKFLGWTLFILLIIAFAPAIIRGFCHMIAFMFGSIGSFIGLLMVVLLVLLIIYICKN